MIAWPSSESRIPVQRERGLFARRPHSHIVLFCAGIIPILLTTGARTGSQEISADKSHVADKEVERNLEVADWPMYVSQILRSEQLKAGEQGLRLILGDDFLTEREDGRKPSPLSLSLGPLDPQKGPARPLAGSGMSYVSVVRRADPGIYRISFTGATSGGGTRALIVPILRGRQTEVVLHRDAQGKIQTTMYAPRVGDPLGRSERTLQLLGDAQRDLISYGGRTAREGLAELSVPRVDDPFGALISAYFLTIDGRPDELAAASADLIRRFPELPDGYILEGLSFEVIEDDASALAAYGKALDTGLPVLLPFFEHLWDGVRVRRGDAFRPVDIDSTYYRRLLREVGRSRIPYDLWSIWDCVFQEETTVNRAD